jgi:hypothetical protein
MFSGRLSRGSRGAAGEARQVGTVQKLQSEGVGEEAKAARGV